MDLPDHNGVTAQACSRLKCHPRRLRDCLESNNVRLENFSFATSAMPLIVVKSGWPAGSGGWKEDRLASYELDMSCDIDQYWADELNAKNCFTNMWRT